MSTVLLPKVVMKLVRAWVYSYTNGLAAAVRDARRQEIASDLWEHQRYGTLRGRHPATTAGEVFGRFLMGIPADLVWRWEQRMAQVGQASADAGERRGTMDSVMSQQSNRQKWFLMILVALAAFSVYEGLSNLSGTGENTLVDVLGRLGAGITGGFVPAAIAVVGLICSWRSPTTGVAVTLGLVFLYLGALQAWVGMQEGWINESLLSALGAAGAALYLTALAISRRRPNSGGLLAMVGAVAMAVVGWWTLIMPLMALLLGVFGLRRAQRFANDQKAFS